MIFQSLFTFSVGRVHLHHVSLLIHPSNRAEREKHEIPTNEINYTLRNQITTVEKGSQNLLEHTELCLHLFHGRSSHLIQRGAGCFTALEVRRLGGFLGILGLILLLALLGRLLIALLGRLLIGLLRLFGLLGHLKSCAPLL